MTDNHSDAIIDAADVACVWAGAQQVLDEYRHDPSVDAACVDDLRPATDQGVCDSPLTGRHA